MLGRPDPRHTCSGQTDTRLIRQQRGYKKKDPPPRRLQPIPLELLHMAQTIGLKLADDRSLCTVDMLWLAFFFLLRTGEYSTPTEETHPFAIRDVRFQIGDRLLDPITCTNSEMNMADFVSLELTDQKNGHKGEKIGHGNSTDAFICPVKLIARRIQYLRSLTAPATTYLCAYKDHKGRLVNLKSNAVTILLRSALLACPHIAYQTSQISAESLRASGAMALLNEGVDPNIIRMIGRWNSDAMLQYLHVQSHKLMRHYSALMLHDDTPISRQLRDLRLRARLPQGP